MNITLQLQKLDELIVAHTQPPVTTILRNQLHPLLDQLEAYEAAADKKSAAYDEQARQMAQLEKDHEKQISDLFLLEAHKQNRDT